VELVAEARDVKRDSPLEHLRVREGALHRAGKRENAQLPGLRQWKNALREHPEDEFFGFAESNSFYLTDAQGRVKTPTP